VQSTPTPARMARDFIRSRQHIKIESEREWLKAVFGSLLKVARSNSSFIIDDVWTEIERLESNGKMPKTRLDPRIIGVMLQFATTEGVIEPSGYYTKSDRPGSRPVTVWNSGVYTPRKVAA
jgi:hypothetical protein